MFQKKLILFITILLSISVCVFMTSCDGTSKKKDDSVAISKNVFNNNDNTFRIKVDKKSFKQGLSLCESKDATIVDSLFAQGVDEITNITYDWLPTDLDNESDGEHNGDNYLAYTFYLTNTSKETLDYESELCFTDIAKNADEALRVMIYKDGEPTIYAQKNRDGSELENIVDEQFVEGQDDIDKHRYAIMNELTQELQPEQTVKYTIVTWIEGLDPECISDIMGGHVKMQWLFNVV